ncbi:MAG: hypothetical protein KDB07_03810 [Planctomycetes bacterium]|nr:hypothetical protein [Planctomycetota bacterium]
MARILITAGPTREAIDDVRFLSNRATGSFGVMLAAIAKQRGHQVTLVLGPSSLQAAAGVEVLRVESAQEMFEAVQANFANCDVFVSSAAVADYRPKQRIDGKLKKQEGELVLELERTPDILAWAGAHKEPHHFLVGFALESDPDPALAESKLVRKKCDLLVHNSPKNFGVGGGLVRIIDVAGEVFAGEIDKAALASRLLDEVAARCGQR